VRCSMSFVCASKDKEGRQEATGEEADLEVKIAPQ